MAQKVWVTIYIYSHDQVDCIDVFSSLAAAEKVRELTARNNWELNFDDEMPDSNVADKYFKRMEGEEFFIIEEKEIKDE